MEEVKKTIVNLQAPAGRRQFLQKNKLNLIIYFVFIVLMLLVYHFLSDGDFSFLLTLGAFIRLFGFCMLLFRIFKDKSCQGISVKTQILYSVVFLFRLFSILVYEGYLPYDSSGDWLYQAIEVISLVVVGVIIYAALGLYSDTWKAEGDPFGNNIKALPKASTPLLIAVPCLVLAMFIHPNLNQNFFTDTAWTFAMYLETLAVMPQLYAFHKQKAGEVEPWTSHFVFSLGLSRFLMLLFWASSYHELSVAGSSITGGWVGLFVLLNQIIHMLVMADYCYYYINSIRTESPLVLSSQIV